ncbi:hypothetical protein DET57_11095 [Klebsiella oxytoca]|uniref:Lipoprotein n=1 Tax=Klebsiella oxytoca TaxID=571 RepID=A0A318FNT7_KLEOX|nr:hypothetical protein DET57_11095 [Klebsiella oxytoca]
MIGDFKIPKYAMPALGVVLGLVGTCASAAPTGIFGVPPTSHTEYRASFYSSVVTTPTSGAAKTIMDCYKPEFAGKGSDCGSPSFPPPLCTEVQTGTRLPGVVDGMLINIVDYKGQEILVSGWNVTGYPISGNMKLSGTYTGRWESSYRIECTMDITNASVPIYDGTEPGAAPYTRSYVTWSYDLSIKNNQHGISVSEPTRMNGTIGDRVSSNFTISVPSWVQETPLTLSWDVGGYCAQWDPALSRTNDSGISIGHSYASELIINDTETDMTASFTPNRKGDFTCTGNLRFNYD